MQEELLGVVEQDGSCNTASEIDADVLFTQTEIRQVSSPPSLSKELPGPEAIHPCETTLNMIRGGLAIIFRNLLYDTAFLRIRRDRSSTFPV